MREVTVAETTLDHDLLASIWRDSGFAVHHLDTMTIAHRGNIVRVYFHVNQQPPTPTERLKGDILGPENP